MNKKPIIIANWKMNLGKSDALELAKSIINKKPKIVGKVEVVICPSFTTIASVSSLKPEKADIKLGAQDVFWENRGSFTGEISPLTLKEFGCDYVIIGHSERRGYLGETDEMVHKKVKAALACGLNPVLCVGENFEERQKGQKDYVIMNQVSKALEGIDLSEENQLLIAYEPVWVIGSGQAIKPEEAEYTSQLIRSLLWEDYSKGLIENNIRIIYGGSVDKNNVAEFTREKTIDGVLVGGASLKVDEFIGLIEAVAAAED